MENGTQVEIPKIHTDLGYEYEKGLLHALIFIPLRITRAILCDIRLAVFASFAENGGFII